MKKAILSLLLSLLLCGILCIFLCACDPHGSPASSDPSINETQATDTNTAYTTGDLDTYYKTTVPLTEMTPAEVISKYKAISHGQADGGYPTVIFHEERPFSFQGRKVSELEPDRWTLVGTLKYPVYPWVRPKEELVSNCLPEGTEVYKSSEDGKTMLAASCENGFAVFE